MSAVRLFLSSCLLSLPAVSAGPDVHRVVVEQGSDVMLPCSLSTKQNIQSQLFDWKKAGGPDEREVFLYDKKDVYSSQSGQSDLFKGRVSHFPAELKNGNASITITNTKLSHSGNYTCEFPRLQPPQIFHVELFVGAVLKDRTGENITGAAPKPIIEHLDQTDTWALLQCEVQGSPEPTVEWTDSDGKTLPAGTRQTSPRGGRQYFTVNATVTRTGRYRCVATQEKYSHQIHAETFVHFNGAAPEPSITIVDATQSWFLLQCKVRGVSPEPRLQWRDSDGHVLPAEEAQVSQRDGGRYDAVLKATVYKTGRYRCLATQEGINHQTDAETFVSISGSTGWVGIVVAVFLTLLAVAVVLAVLRSRGYMTLNCNKASAAKSQTAAENQAENQAELLSRQ